MIKPHAFHVCVNYPAQFPRHAKRKIQFTRSELGIVHRFRSVPNVTHVTDYCQSRF